MAILISSGLIVIAIAIANILAKFVPGISNTYVNLAMGIVFGLIPLTDKLILGFNNEIFMFAIIAPLLFFEGQGTRNFVVRNQASRIIGMSVILAIITAILVGWSINLVFGMFFPFTLIMAAISTPTDATAFDSVVEGREIPDAVGNNLKMESLFNDATGIILLAAGLTWLQTGHLSFTANISSFLVSAVGGVIFGAVFAYLVMIFRQILVRSKVNVISSQTIIFLITPFVIYYLAEEIHVSGIIAVVCAGLVSNSEASRSRFSSSHQFHLGTQLMLFISEVLNSFVFVTLGITLVRIIRDNFQEITLSFSWLWIGIMIYLVSLIVRYLYAKFIMHDTATDAVTFSFGGIHGAVTLAMVFSVSRQIVGQKNFDLLILIETVVIILSMVVPTILFKFTLTATPDDTDILAQVADIRDEMVKRGIAQVNEMHLDKSVRKSVIYDLRDQNKKNDMFSFLHQWRAANKNRFDFDEKQRLDERRALMYAFDVERDYLHDVSLEHRFYSSYLYTLHSEVLLAESLVLDPINQQN
ncbi:cation:proton antiporter [Companilactobacillus ginsenosidimutans]|uniref:Sodium:proton antiporter n=1 Tax=Companilactobacillus ginsenosidimutans TaxID=1007676 RepID=A0A0H4QHG7_9LACO|nr:sodium:proton antiporter [Companilactobacillus ginsenosidimutans]AKP67859.1 sodium:proton antiporter [Companilactobacillus ginsenosidimutans]